MTAITIEYLGGVAYSDARAAGHPNRAEWPPHPDRLFMALVAAWGRAGCDTAEQKALEWLESQPPPTISASDASLRPTLTAYSPVNDRLPNDKQFKQKLGSVSHPHRGRHVIDFFKSARNKERHLASVVPESPRVTFAWHKEVPVDVEVPLRRVVERITYLGSSESVVTGWLSDISPEPTWVPTDAGERTLRVPHTGRLRDLQVSYEAGAPPSPSAWTAYSPANTAETPITGEWSMLLPFEVVGPVDLRHTVRLARAVRTCLLAACPDPIPSWVSGHSSDGGQLRSSHVGVVPLANVGHAYGDGRVLGVGLTIPAEVPTQERLSCLGSLCPEHQKIGDQVVMRRVVTTRATLDPDRWTRPSTSWGTVTPIACHRWPKQGNVAAVVRRDIAQAGLPEPAKIEVLRVSPLKGGLYGPAFDAPKRYRVHAAIHWAHPVAGPMAIGAGRYLGLGFCGRLP